MDDAYAWRVKPTMEKHFGRLEMTQNVLKNRSVDIHCLTVPFTKKDYDETGVPVPEDSISQGLLGDIHNKSVYFAIRFADADCAWRLHRDHYDVRHTYSPGENALPQIKSHTSVPIKYLTDIIHDADPEPEISPEARIHHEEAVR